jgi:uncharacterized membrane protein HdeD (DUF308 family)
MRPGDELVGRGRADAAQQTAQGPSRTTETREARDPNPSTELRDILRGGVRDATRVWWWYLILGIAWTWYGMFVLSYRVGSLAAVAGLVGVAFLFGGFGLLMMAGRVDSMRPLLVVTGILGIAAGIATFVWPDITLYVVSLLVAWFLIVYGIVHLVSSLAGPKVSWWWTQLLLGIAELVLGVWAIRSWERSLLTFMTLVGVWAIVSGVNEIFAAFALREAGKQVERSID